MQVTDLLQQNVRFLLSKVHQPPTRTRPMRKETVAAYSQKVTCGHFLLGTYLSPIDQLTVIIEIRFKYMVGRYLANQDHITFQSTETSEGKLNTIGIMQRRSFASLRID